VTDRKSPGGWILADRGHFYCRPVRSNATDVTIRQGDPEVTAAMLSVMVDGTSATDAWLAFVRLHYPDAAFLLARLAMTGVALELLVATGHLERDEAARQRTEALSATVSRLPPRVWNDISKVRDALGRIERLARSVRDTPTSRDGRITHVA